MRSKLPSIADSPLLVITVPTRTQPAILFLRLVAGDLTRSDTYTFTIQKVNVAFLALQ